MKPSFSCCSGCSLLLLVLGDSEFSTIVAALGANVVIHNLCAAVAASSQLCGLQRIVRSSLGRSGLRESVFWMWHIITFFCLFISLLVVSPSPVPSQFVHHPPAHHSSFITHHFLQCFPSWVNLTVLLLFLLQLFLALDVSHRLRVASSLFVAVLQRYAYRDIFI